MKYWIELIILIVVMFCCFKACEPVEEKGDPVKFWHEALQRTVKRHEVRDNAYSDSINELQSLNKSKRVEYREKVVQAKPRILTDTVLAYIIADCDTIIKQDSSLIVLWSSRYYNQKALSDSLQASILVLDSIYRVELNESNREGNKKFWRGFLWGFGSGYFTGRITP